MSNPFAEAAENYLAAGFKPMPITSGLKKLPPPVAATGYSGTVTPEKVADWLRVPTERNIALRLEGLIAIDVDDGYKGKEGASDLDKLVETYGDLPVTFSSTARGDNSPSRQYFFRVPEGVKLDSKPAPSIEIVQLSHRYSVVYPSIHPDTGNTYQWYTPSGARLNAVPQLTSIPYLPETWLEGLQVAAKEYDESRPIVAGEEFIGNLPDHRMCPKVRAVVDDFVQQGTEDHIGHDAMINYQFSLLSFGRDGHAGAPTALAQLWELFNDYVAIDPYRDAVDEWTRALENGVKRVQQVPKDDSPWELVETCGCKGNLVPRERPEEIAVGNEDPIPRGVLDDFMGYIESERERDGFLPATQEGAGLRFVEAYGQEICYVPGLGWGVYDGKRWELGGERASAYADVRMRTVKAVVREELDTLVKTNREAQKRLAEAKSDLQPDPVKLNDAETVAALTKAKVAEWNRFLSNLQSTSYVSQSLEAARVLITQEHDAFDADPLTLNVRNGTLKFTDVDGQMEVELCPHTPADLISHLAPVEWDQDLYDSLVLKGEQTLKGTFFGDTLFRAQKQEDNRLYLAKLSGLTMIGDNRKRLLSISYGSGANLKSTFIGDALRDTLGPDLAQDIDPATVTKATNGGGGGPRSDLVSLRGLRMVHVPEVTDELDTNLLKRMSGGELIKARAPYAKSDVVFKPKFVVWMSTNDMPQASDISDGFWRRTKVIPWVNKVPLEEQIDTETVSAKMSENRELILAWMVWGLSLYFREDLKDTDDIAEATTETRTEQDWRMDIIDSYLIEDPDGYVSGEGLWQMAENRASHEGYPTKNRFYKAMRDVLGEREVVKVDGRTTKVWKGYKLKTQRDWNANPAF